MKHSIATAALMAAVGLLIACTPVAAPPVVGPAPLYTVPGTFQIGVRDGEATLGILDGQGGEIASYDLAGCRLLDGDGAFALVLPGATEPMVATICHPDGGGQRFAVYAPARDRKRPVLEVTGDSFVRVAVLPGALLVSRDADGRTKKKLWNPGVAADAAELSYTRDLMAAAAGRRFDAPEPADDPELRALAAELAQLAASRDTEALVALAAPDILLSFGGNEGVEELRGLASLPWFWPEFARVLEGGGVMSPSQEGGRVAVFPELFHDWPADLDAFGHFYGDRPGARLRAGPSDDAPAIADLYLRIVARGPYLEANQQLREDGWVHVCTQAEGCGFARKQHVRSPIDWRAILTREQPGAPWVLETYVAGD